MFSRAAASSIRAWERFSSDIAAIAFGQRLKKSSGMYSESAQPCFATAFASLFMISAVRSYSRPQQTGAREHLPQYFLKDFSHSVLTSYTPGVDIRFDIV